MYLSRQFIITAIFLSVLFIPVVGFAADDTSIGIVNPLSVGSLDAFVRELVTVARNIGMLIAVLGIVYAGMLKITAQGDEEKLRKANKAFLWSIIGTSVILGAWLIAVSIQGTVQELEDSSRLLYNVYNV